MFLPRIFGAKRGRRAELAPNASQTSAGVTIFSLLEYPMNTIPIVGLGPGPVGQLTKEAGYAPLPAEKIFFRTCA